jgi:hypothetical protein
MSYAFCFDLPAPFVTDLSRFFVVDGAFIVITLPVTPVTTVTD